MQHYPTEPLIQSPLRFDPLDTARRRIAWATRLMTLAEWWAEFDEPIEYLEDPEAILAEDARCLIELCEAHAIVHQQTERGPAFPNWLLKEFYPENP